MENKITYWLLVLLIVFIVLFSFSLNGNIEKNIQIDEFATKEKQLRDSLVQSQKAIDSLNIRSSNKEQTIINNTYIYEKENKKIGNANITVTDSLFKTNLQSGYKKYGHFITK